MKNPTLLAQLTAKPHTKPCDARWDDMVGDDRMRHCESCARTVYDISAMSAREAEIRLLNSGEHAPCLRYGRHADGTIEHAPEPRLTAPFRSMRPHFAAAAALGVTISASPVLAKDQKNAPDQCVAFVKQADVDKQVEVAAAKPKSEPSDGAAGFAEAPAATRAAAAAPPAPPPEPEPVRLGGAVAPPQREPMFGTLAMTSKVAREVSIVGIKLQAPLSNYLLTPGDFVAEVRDPNGKVRQVKFKITAKKTTKIDLDKK
jgi:hypothetical protein